MSLVSYCKTHASPQLTLTPFQTQSTRLQQNLEHMHTKRTEGANKQRVLLIVFFFVGKVYKGLNFGENC